MGIETKEKFIGDANYAVTQMPARRAIRVKSKLIKIFGTSITQLFLNALDEKVITNDKEDTRVVESQLNEIKKNSIVKGIQFLCENIDEKTFEDLVLELIPGVRRNGVEMNQSTIDMDFAGRILDLYKVIWFILEVNYADFFELSGIGNLSEELIPQQEVHTKKTYKYV